MEKIKSKGPSEEKYYCFKDEFVLTEGSSSSIIYILIKGKLGIYKNNVKVAEIKRKGVIFGEMSSILGKPRTTSVKAEIDCEVMIYRGGIHSITKKFPSVTIKILSMLAERLDDLNEHYSTLQTKMNLLQSELDEAKAKLQLMEQREDIRQKRSAEDAKYTNADKKSRSTSEIFKNVIESDSDFYNHNEVE